MVRILRDPKGRSIQEGLEAYGWEFLRLNFVLGALALVVLLVVIEGHRQDTNYFLALNEFYSSLEEINNLLYEDIVESNPRNITHITGKAAGMQADLEKLWKLDLGKEFCRDLDDLNAMFGAYRAGLGEIYELLAAGGDHIETIFDLYKDTQDIFTFLNKDFQKMYTQILSYVAQKEERQWAERIVFLCVCVAFFALWTKKKIRETDKIAKKISDPVRALAEAAKQVQEGDFLHMPQWEKGEDTFTEIEILQRLLMEMVETLKRQMAEIIENAELRDQVQKSEIKALQMQINPHFLFNTLNTIAKMAYMEQASSTALLLECTASLLRYTLDNSMKMVPLGKELDMSKNYVSIQENRFGERIQFRFLIDKSLNGIETPRLILQPILENAVIHGVGMKVNDARIEIKTCCQDGRCVLSVTDNGAGIEDGRLQEVLDKMRTGSQDGKNIGLANIYARLRFFYGDAAQLEIKSKTGEGTQVAVIFPIPEKGGGNCVSDYHCR